MVSHIFRECFIISGLHLQLMANSVSMSFPSILVPALSGDHPKMKVSEDELNFILGVFFLASPVGFIFFPWMMQRFGRKITNISINIGLITGSIIIASIPTPTALIVGRILHGISVSGCYIGCTLTAEYTHPKRRGFHIVFKGISGAIGEFICHSLGLAILTYQQTVLLVAIPAFLSILVTLKWPESPQYLAYKERFEQCSAAFEWIRGTDNEARRELHELILSQKERKKLVTDDIVSRFRDAVQSKGFWRPMFVIFWVDIACIASAYMFITSYVSEIVYMITGDRVKAYYYTIVLDIMKTLSVLVSSVVVKSFRRRTVLFSSGAAASLVLVTLCLLYYFAKDVSIAVNWVTPITFAIYYIIINVAVGPITIVIQGEVIPIKYKGIGTVFSGLLIMLGVLLMMTYAWEAIQILDLHGVFGIYLVIFIISYVMLLICLPETKDRTLQDIENEFVERSVNYETIESDIVGKLVSE